MLYLVASSDGSQGGVAFQRTCMSPKVGQPSVQGKDTAEVVKPGVVTATLGKTCQLRHAHFSAPTRSLAVRLLANEVIPTDRAHE